MKKSLFILLLYCLCVNVKSQSEENYIVKEKFVFHQLDFLETGTDRILDSFPDGSGVIIKTEIESQDFLIIHIPDVYTYKLQIVNQVVDKPNSDCKVVMLQGGEIIEGQGAYTANIFFVYDLIKNENTPEFIRFQIHNSPNILVFSGIIKLLD